MESEPAREARQHQEDLERREAEFERREEEYKRQQAEEYARREEGDNKSSVIPAAIK